MIIRAQPFPKSIHTLLHEENIKNDLLQDPSQPYDKADQHDESSLYLFKQKKMIIAARQPVQTGLIQLQGSTPVNTRAEKMPRLSGYIEIGH